MSLSRAENRSLALGGFVLAHGVWRIAGGAPIEPVVALRQHGEVAWVPIRSADPLIAGAAFLETAAVRAAAMLFDEGTALVVHIWHETAWDWEVRLRYRRDSPLRVDCAELGSNTPRWRRDEVLDAVLEGVGHHPGGLLTWASAEHGRVSG